MTGGEEIRKAVTWRCRCGQDWLCDVRPSYDGLPWDCTCGDRIPGALVLALVAPVVPDPIPITDSEMEHELSVVLYWNWSKGYTGDPDTPDDPPHLEDVTVMLGEHDITDLLAPDVLADVREAMMRDMEAGQ